MSPPPNHDLRCSVSQLPLPAYNDWTSAERACEQLFVEHSAQPQALAAVALRVPAGLSPQLLSDAAAHLYNETVVYRTDGDVLFIGLGCAMRLRSESLHPFSDVQNQLPDVELLCSPELRPYVRFFGGGAFDPRRSHDESCWVNFGNATLLLPELGYWEQGRDAVLVVVSTQARCASVFSRVRELLTGPFEHAVLAPDQQRERSPSPPLRVLGQKESVDAQAWEALLGEAQQQISAGTLDKVVTARRVTFELSSAPRLAEVVARLIEQAPCTAFALRLGQRIFFGATPETLIKKTDREISTEALAGTRALLPQQSPAECAALLLGSEKDRREHAFVAETIRSTLQPFCLSLSAAEQPSAHILPHLVHLRTPLSGVLSRSAHVLELVDALHPTPAVGGVPQEAALDFIGRHERVERGWYAAPFGWCTQEGDGHFVVALRSALLSGNKVHVYAGAGIVARSHAATEYAETELKMGSVLRSLGLAS